jgi:hypothetical protein
VSQSSLLLTVDRTSDHAGSKRFSDIALSLAGLLRSDELLRHLQMKLLAVKS